ncbi:MAG TPA: sugar phosphate isomerase/epimerase family protein [Ruminiclostridium sp.]|nr:sugar phosphate isomerase/epimerase family protein [Ruminiclostridium sp.]
MEYLEYCNLGIVYGMAEPNYHSLQKLRQVLQDSFFSAIEIRDFWSYSEKEQAELRRILNISLMEVTYETQPLQLYNPDYNLNSPELFVRQRTISRLKKEIDAAALLNARSVVTTSGKFVDGIPVEEQIQYLTDSLICIASYAREKGIFLVLEPFDRDIDKKMLVGSVPHTLQIVKQVRTQCQNFGILIDCGRFPLFLENSREMVEALGDYIMQVHIGNCVLSDPENAAYGDKHPRFGIGSSLIDAEEIALFLKDLYDIGFLEKGGSRIISLEARPTENEEPELMIANLKRTFVKSWMIFKRYISESR